MPLHTSYTPNYFSIDDILATQERVPCKLSTAVPNLGKLNPSNEEADLKAGTVLELPLWLAKEASHQYQSIVTISLPKIFKETYQEILKADASAVDLQKFSKYFYEFGSYIRHFDQRNDVAGILIKTFEDRFRQLMNLVDDVNCDPTASQKIDKLEEKILIDAKLAKSKLDLWLRDSIAPITASDMVINHKKRKRLDFED